MVGRCAEDPVTPVQSGTPLTVHWWRDLQGDRRHFGETDSDLELEAMAVFKRN